MFTCCARYFRTKDLEDNEDNDYRWKTGTKTAGYSKRHGSNSSNSRPPIFYIDSGESTDTDAANPLQTTWHGGKSDLTNRTTSDAKLDPNSQLQRKSKLHNEKLPSFSALDRTKRPRTRREEAINDTDSSCAVTVYEPLTFETFRSNTPPLAVIAPLSKANSPTHSFVTDTRCTVDHYKPGQLKVVPDIHAVPQAEERSPGYHGCGSYPNSTTGEGEDFYLHGRINEAYYSSDEDVSNTPRFSSSPHGTVTTSQIQTRFAKRPTTLQLPLSKTANSSFSSRHSWSTFPAETSSCVDTVTNSDVISMTVTPEPDDSLGIETEQNKYNRKVCSDEKSSLSHSANRAFLSNDEQVISRIHPDSPVTLKKIPPKKPKRKNPPSNVSTAASRDAIAACLTSRAVSSQSPERHSDVNSSCPADLEDGDVEVQGVLLTPPRSFMDQDYAGFDSFDEVNGSLV